MNKQQALKEIVEAKARIEAAKARIEAAEAILSQPESCGRERLEGGRRYYVVSAVTRCVSTGYEGGAMDDEYNFAMGNYYHTTKEAEKARDRQLAYVRITDAIREQNKGWVPTWRDNGNEKYSFIFNTSTGHVISNSYTPWLQDRPNELYGTKEAIEYVIKHHADDIKLYLEVTSV